MGILIGKTTSERSWQWLTFLKSFNTEVTHRDFPKGNQSWIFIGRTDAEAEAPVLWPPHENIHWTRPWCWERLKAGGEGDDRGWDGWMASLIQWTWVWANSGRWWRTGKPGVLRSVGSQSGTQLSNWTTTMHKKKCKYDKESHTNTDPHEDRIQKA